MENKRLRVTDSVRILKNFWKFIPMGIFFLFITVVPTIATAQAQKTVSGKVSDPTGAPLPGVSVVIKGTTNGSITDFDGNYTLQNVPANATLTFSFIGMQAQDIPIGERSVLNVTLEETTIGIEEVVAIGYGVQKKKLVTGATVQVDGEDLERLNTVSPMQALQSNSPGLNITETSGEPGAGFKVTIRGIGTMGNSQPLYIVDGVPRDNINYFLPKG